MSDLLNLIDKLEKAEACVVDGCDLPAHTKKRGLCRKHQERLLVHGDVNAVMCTEPGEMLEWLKQHIGFDGSECLVWPYRSKRSGYPCDVAGDGHSDSAHRRMCEMVNGPAPSGESVVAHSCGNGALGCVHPKHVRWATAAENSLDAIDHGRTMRGEKNRHNRLTKDEVREIRAKFLSGESGVKIAAEYGISSTTAYNIRDGKIWGWLV